MIEQNISLPALHQETDSTNAIFRFPTSFAQQRLWFLDQLEPGGSFYNIALTLQVQGSLCVAALRRSLLHVVERHEVLRTTFEVQGGEPVQCITTTFSVPFPLLDVSGLPSEQRDEQVLHLAHEEVQRPFDLRNGALLRALLIRVDCTEHLLVLTLHHIITDGWSQGILLRELAEGYEKTLRGYPPDLAPLPVQYADYAVWQWKRMQGARLSRQLAYWKRQLEDAVQILDLPTDRPRPAVQRHRGATVSQVLSLSLARSVRQVSQQEQVTPFMALLSAFAILIARMSGQEDILIGTAIAGRTKRELEHLIGFFANTLPLRLKLDSHLSGRQMLQRVRELTLQAYANQDVPFERIVEEVQPQRDLSRNPLLQVFFTFDNTPGELPAFGGLTFRPVDNFVRSTHFDIDFLVMEVGEELQLLLTYDTDLFSRVSMLKLLERYQLVLENLLEHLTQKVAQLPWLLEGERRQIIEEWVTSSEPATEERTLVELFRQQVRLRPEAIAVSEEQIQLSYSELEIRTNQLAHYLCQLGVTHDVPVGICIDRSYHLIIAMLGIIKAGGAYLPLDVDAPLLRKQQLLEGAKASICLFQEQQDPLARSSTVTPIYLNDWQTVAGFPSSPPSVWIHPEHLISIYFTSGSTGQPKGVASTHRGWSNRMAWMQKRYQLQPGEIVLQKTTMTFDDAAVEVFWPLSVGGRVALLGAGLHKDPLAILKATIRYQVSILQFVPSMLLLFVELISSQIRPSITCLRQVISSGEALRPELVRLFLERLGCELHNQWGLTEVSIDSTAYLCSSADAVDREILSIGRPIAGHEVYILDAFLQPVPPGIVGELYLAGIGLARGYLHDPARTGEVFLPHPFASGERMYKTGDRGYYRLDGTIMFLGRKDDQVKVRGQRLELGEIEAVLAEYPGILNCAVVARKREDGYRLTGYVVPHSAEECSQEPGQLIKAIYYFLRERLPEYMVPGRIILLDALPTTTSGKVDRKLLPEPDEERPEWQQEYSSPATATEQMIATIWQQVLGITQVGRMDNFFQLGGHSLDATRAISQLNQTLNLQLPLKAIFEGPTVAALALHVEQELMSANAGACSVVARLPQQESYEASHAQERLWFASQLDPDHSYGVVLALELEGDLNQEILHRVLCSVVARHSILRTTFVEREGQLRQRVHEEQVLPYHYVDFSALPPLELAAQLARRGSQFKSLPFDLITGPIFRVELHKLAERQHRLLWSIHSIAFDSWSLSILMEEIATLYPLFKAGRSERELTQPLQYRDYAFWQNRRLEGHELNFQRTYWQEQLAAFLPMPKLPADGEEKHPYRRSSPYRLMTIERELTEKLYTLSTTHGVTLFMTLLAGLKIWLAHTLKRTDIAIGSPVSGRITSELEGVFGTLWNPVILRTDLSGNPSYLQILERVSETVLGAFAHQEYPFDLVLQDYRRQYGVTAPLYSLVFILQNASKSSLSFEGMTMQVSLSERLTEDEDGEMVNDGFDDSLTARYDLYIEAYELDGTIILATQYDSNRFSGNTVDCWHAQFVSILEQFISSLGGRLSQLVLSEPDQIDELFAPEEEMA